MKSPGDAMTAVIGAALVGSHLHPRKQPGAVLERMPAHVREALCKLSSDDPSVRAPLYVDDDEATRYHKQLSVELMAFDKKLKVR